MWFKVCDKLHSHRKIRAARRGHPTKRNDAATIGVWALAGSWCGDTMSDGFIPEDVVATFDDDWPTIAARLVEAGLWTPDVVDDEPGWRFHDWTDYNDSRAKIETTRRLHAMRVALQRDVPLITAIKKRDKDRCRYCGTSVDWRDRRSGGAATYDHVKPISAGGKNTLENVVVCCKACNDRKNERTLKDAGMRLLEPGALGAPVLDDPTPAPTRIKNVSSTDLDTPRSTTGSGRVGSGACHVTDTDPDTSAPGTSTPSGDITPQPGEHVDPTTGEITNPEHDQPQDGA